MTESDGDDLPKSTLPVPTGSGGWLSEAMANFNLPAIIAGPAGAALSRLIGGAGPRSPCYISAHQVACHFPTNNLGLHFDRSFTVIAGENMFIPNRLCALVLVAMTASSVSLNAADAPRTKAGPLIGRDWNEYCEQRRHPKPACIDSCKDVPGSQGNQSCRVYCNDGWFAGTCLTTVSCPRTPC
jgi:hypothetical protein